MTSDQRIELSEVFEDSIENLWQALTDPSALADWLMPNSFQPQVGEVFELSADDPDCGGGVVRCRLLVFDPPHRMVWSWTETEGPNLDTTEVSFTLTPEGPGCRLTIEHRGLTSKPEAESFRQGWSQKLAALKQHLTR